MTSEAITRGVRVRVRPRYLADHSNPPERWIFTYAVEITNVGKETVQLLSRHWVITDAHGHVEEVRGPGVVGAQPLLAPGESFEYTSFCPLPTAYGTMHGTYQMITSEGETFDAEVAAFHMSTPYAVN